MATSAPIGSSLYRKIAFQWKRGWNEIPEVMGAAAMAVGSAIGLALYWPFQPPEKENRRYKREFYVMRSDDPRLEFVRRYPDSPEPTKMEYLEFLGIPYAKPPIGKLRFESPQPAEKWDGILSATEFGAECKGFEFMMEGSIQGDESCLFLNVMTPKLKDNSSTSGKLLPVLVYIHGGAFHMRSGKGFGGKFLMDEDIVLVTINYRLGIFGFLNTDDSVIKGNMGLKDQVLALKWIQANIDLFGGDRNQVTIMGPSAGGASVHMLMLSPMGKGLFHRGISTGCEALSDMWQLSRNNSEHIELTDLVHTFLPFSKIQK
ncbi:unnamed protein product [Allacma fusca]|uniref:Carboxylic ester hydrolase n=1 Tax=Allacma fusca TaxID=39272 RepID=A0A8J2J9F1_9HEXA|nr:unnamed protein product [Allacma fusca]